MTYVSVEDLKDRFGDQNVMAWVNFRTGEVTKQEARLTTVLEEAEAYIIGRLSKILDTATIDTEDPPVMLKSLILKRAALELQLLRKSSEEENTVYASLESSFREDLAEILEQRTLLIGPTYHDNSPQVVSG